MHFPDQLFARFSFFFLSFPVSLVLAKRLPINAFVLLLFLPLFPNIRYIYLSLALSYSIQTLVPDLFFLQVRVHLKSWLFSFVFPHSMNVSTEFVYAKEYHLFLVVLLIN